MTESAAQPSRPRFVETSLFRKLEVAFWIVFIALPIFTGWLAYHWLPNESYDEKEHELLLGREVGDPQEHVVRPEMWRDKKTGEVFMPAHFSEHRAAEAKRLAATDFAYGLIGCIFYAWARSQKKNEPFFEAFGKAVALNLVIAIYTFFSIGS